MADAADLVIEKVASQNEVEQGDNFYYDLTVRNDGGTVATSVLVRDILPAGILYVSDTCGGGTTGQVWSWSVGTLAPGASATCRLNVQVDPDHIGDSFVNVASVSGVGEASADFANNSVQSVVVVPDADGDGLVGLNDNCPSVPNPGQENFDGDALGDDCEDSDGDGCLDAAELGDDPTRGGLRNPDIEWDFFDPTGPRGGPPDGIIDLPNDLLGVILRFSPDGEGDYDVRFDRGRSVGPYAWNMTAPDGVIDLTNDILGVILQFQHDCR